MSAVQREYRVRIATPGKDVVEGNVATTLGLADLARVPVVTGQIVHPTNGATETRPFEVLALDRGGFLTAIFAENRRWVALGRLLDVQYRDLPAGVWTTYGTGRISALDEADGPGRFRLDVSDESWKARSSRIFTAGDTTQVWPHGIKANWRGWSGAVPADGAREAQRGNLYRIRLRAGRGNRGRYIAPSLIEWADSDAVDYEERRFGADAVEGNFRNLRLRYAGIDYKIVSFGPVEAHGDILDTLKNPEDKNSRSEYRELTIRAWVYSHSTPPASGVAYLHAPGAAPSEDLPLHVGLADPTHDWGTESGWFHPATLTRRYWDLTGQRYDSAGLAALEADTSFPALAFLITEVPKDPDRWFQDHVWGSSMLAVLRDGQGRRKLVDMRLPQNIDPDTLPVIHAGNSTARTWRLVGREAANHVIWSYLHTIQHGFGAAAGEGLGGDAGLDGIVAQVREDTPREGDTVATLGARPLSLSLIGAHEPTASWPDRALPGILNSARGTTYRSAVEVMTRDLLDIYQDGAVIGAVELGRTLAETLEEGSLALLDESSFRGPNPDVGARSGFRLVRIISLTRHPSHAEAEYLDLGPSAQPLAQPHVGIALDPASSERIIVTLSDVPAGAVATLEVAYTDGAGEPTVWPIRRAGEVAGTLTFGGAPGSGYAHVRAKATAPGRIRSRWASASVALAASPRVSAVEVVLDDNGAPEVAWAPNQYARGVRIHYAVADAGPGSYSLDLHLDADASALALTLPTIVSPGQLVDVEVEPWTTWSGGAVGGTAGPRHAAIAYRPGEGGTYQPGNFVTATSRWNRLLALFLDIVTGLDTHSLRVQFTRSDSTPVNYLIEYPSGGGGAVSHQVQSLGMALPPHPPITLTPYSGPAGTGEVGTAIVVTEGGGDSPGIRARQGAGPVIQADYLEVGTGLALSTSVDGRPVLAASGGAYLPLAGGTLLGSLGIGRAPAPGYALDVEGSARFSGTVYASDFVLSGAPGAPTGLSLDSLDDVRISSPLAGQVLGYTSAGKWQNVAGGFLTNWSDGYTTYDARYRKSADAVPWSALDSLTIPATATRWPMLAEIGAAATTHDHDERYTHHADTLGSIVVLDTRSTNFAPQDRGMGLYVDFRENSADALHDGGVYHGILTFRPWGLGPDVSGGPAHQLAFTEAGNLWVRKGTSATQWGAWKRLVDTTWIAASYLPLSGGTLTGPLTANQDVRVGQGLHLLPITGTQRYAMYSFADSLEINPRDASGNHIGVTGLAMTSAGSIGIGTTSPAYRLDVIGSARFTGEAYASDFILASDRALKEHLCPITDAAARLARIRGYTYAYLRDPTTRRAGVIAQEVREALPEAVVEALDGTLGVSYDSLVPLLVEAINEMAQRLNTLEGAWRAV